MEGWIKLHRKILEWEWYTDAPVRILFEHLLLTANYEDKKWRGMTIKRGQKVTSIGHLAEETGLSVRQVRTALEKLEKTKNVTSRATNKFTLVTIENYSLYQSYNDYTTSNVTNKRQTNDNN
jgi:DNA-binding transcriptional MocR family regulator